MKTRSQEMDDFFRRRGKIRWEIAPRYAGASFILTSIGVSVAMKFAANLPWYIWMPVGIVAGIAASIFGYKAAKQVYDSKNTVTVDLERLTSNKFQYDHYGSPLEIYMIWALNDEKNTVDNVYYATEIMRRVFLDHRASLTVFEPSFEIKPQKQSPVPLLENTREFMQKIEPKQKIHDTDDPISLLHSIVRSPPDHFKPSALITAFQVTTPPSSGAQTLYVTPIGTPT